MSTFGDVTDTLTLTRATSRRIPPFLQCKPESSLNTRFLINVSTIQNPAVSPGVRSNTNQSANQTIKSYANFESENTHKVCDVQFPRAFLIFPVSIRISSSFPAPWATKPGEVEAAKIKGTRNFRQKSANESARRNKVFSVRGNTFRGACFSPGEASVSVLIIPVLVK